MQEIKTIIVDCDGVLTNGKVSYYTSGSRSKEFHSRDITAIKRLISAGFTVWIVSRSSWEGLKHFAKRCGANYCTGVKDKAEWAKRVLKDEPFAAICDDFDDLGLCKLAKWVFIPGDASIKLKNELSDHEGYDYSMLCDIMGGSGIMEWVEGLLNPQCQSVKTTITLGNGQTVSI